MNIFQNKNYKIYNDLMKKNKQTLQKIITLLKLKNYKLKYEFNKSSSIGIYIYTNQQNCYYALRLLKKDILIYCESENILNLILNKYQITNISHDKTQIISCLNNNNIKLFINMFLDICIKLLGK